MNSFVDVDRENKRKAELFETLLQEVVKQVNTSNKRCWFCNGVVLAAPAQVIHTSDCLITRIESAITADAR